MESQACKVDTKFFYKIHQQGKTSSGKEIKSMSSDFFLVINHCVQKKLYVSTGDGEFHSAQVDQNLLALNPYIVDSSIFAYRDQDSVRCSVHLALKDAGVNPETWRAISDAVMVEGIRMLDSNLGIYKRGNSGRSTGFNHTIVITVLTEETFACYEDVGEC